MPIPKAASVTSAICLIPEFAKSVFFQFQATNIPMMLAGGWAVCHHGDSRLTLDVDWVRQRSKQAKALALMEELEFKKCSDGMTSRFKHRREIAYPFIDLNLPELSDHPAPPHVTLGGYEKWIFDSLAAGMRPPMSDKEIHEDFMKNEGSQKEPWPDFGAVMDGQG